MAVHNPNSASGLGNNPPIGWEAFLILGRRPDADATRPIPHEQLEDALHTEDAGDIFDLKVEDTGDSTQVIMTTGVMARDRTEAVCNTLRPLYWALTDNRPALGGMQIQGMFIAPEVDLIVSGHDSLLDVPHIVSDDDRKRALNPLGATHLLLQDIEISQQEFPLG